MQEGTSSAHASPVRGDVHVDAAGASAHRSVHVIQNGHAHLSCGVDEGRRRRMRIFRTADVDGATGTSPFIRAAFPVLLTLEDRKHVGKAPTLRAILGPPIVVGLCAANPHHGIDAGAATKYM